jgi:surface carbohydrate biosynthesis protein
MEIIRKIAAKAKRAANLLFRAKKIWYWPSSVDVLIYDAAGSEYFADYLRAWRVGILHVRGETLNIYALVGSFFRRGKRANAYIDLLIEKYRPRLILTFIDNNPGFWSLKERHPSVTTMFVQNGTRGYYLDAFEILDRELPQERTFHVDYMATFGSKIGCEYNKHIDGLVVPMGSLKNNQQTIKREIIPGSIAFISQFRAISGLTLGRRHFTHQEFFGDVDKPVLKFLANYAERYGKALFVIPCSCQESERRYFEHLLDRKCNFTDEVWKCNSYEALDAAEVVVAIDSTLGYESLARGNRTAIFSVRSEATGLKGMTYGWPDIFPDEGPFWSNNLSLDAFERILNHLFSVTDEEFRREMESQNVSEQIVYDPDNTALRAVFARVLA